MTAVAEPVNAVTPPVPVEVSRGSVREELKRFISSERLVRLTTDQYDEMIRSGALPTTLATELIDGLLVRKDRSKQGDPLMSIGTEHRWSVDQLSRLGRSLEPLGCFVSTQQPVVFPPDHEPEPDGSVLRGSNEDYKTRKPTSADVLCVIEVADSSLAYDRREKLTVYAAAGVAQYVIVNLIDHVVEVYRGPSRAAYASKSTHGRGESFALDLLNGAQHVVLVNDVLP